MGGGHCLICYSLIPNSNTFNSAKNLQDCVSFCKLLQLPVEPFNDILSGSSTCQECTKGLQEGTQVIKRFENLQKELNQLRTNFQNKLKNGHKLSLGVSKEYIDTGDLTERHHEERALIINELKLGGENSVDIPEEIQADYSPFVQVNTDSPGSPDLADSDSDHQEEIHMSKKDISSLLFENDDLAAPRSQHMANDGLSSMPRVSGKKQRKSNRTWIVKPESNLSNCITLKVPRIQLDRLLLPRGQTAFKLKDSIGVIPLQNPPKSASNLPEPIFKHNFVCTLCLKVCVSPDTFYVHSNYFNHTLKTFQCCSEPFPTVARLNQHRKLIHDEVVRKILRPPKRLCQCDECGYRCPFPSTLQAHINTVHLDLKLFPCTWPGCTTESFKSKASLEYHVNQFHKNIKPFLCDLCPKSFAKLGRLNAHRRRCHEQIPGFFPCKQCTFTFTLERNLKSHIRRVHGPISAVRHLCTICGYELKTTNNLRDHLELHKKKGNKFRPRNRSCWKRNPGPDLNAKKDATGTI